MKCSNRQHKRLEKVKEHVRQLEARDLPILRSFQKETFGEETLQLNEEHFHWLYQENRWSTGEQPEIWIYEKEGEVQGQQAGIPFQLQVDGKSYRASWACDLMVKPKYRLRGLGLALTDVYMHNYDVTVGINVSEEAFKGFMWLGWSDLGIVPSYIRLINTRSSLLASMSTSTSAKMAISILRLIRPIADIWCSIYSKIKAAKLEKIDCFDKRVDEVWTVAANRYVAIARRDYDSLHWRFDCGPYAREYERYYLMRGDRILGYAVLRKQLSKGVPASVIVDYLCRPGWDLALFANCVKICKQQGVDAVYCETLHHKICRSLWPFGFIKRNTRKQFIAWVDEEKGPDPEMVKEPKNWFITASDSDAEHY